MKKVLTWFFMAVCVSLLGVALYRFKDAETRSYARVRLLSIFLHRGMDSKSVSRLLGHAPHSLGHIYTGSGGMGPAPGGTRDLYYDGSLGHPFAKMLIVNLALLSDGSYSVTNWAWSDYEFPPNKAHLGGRY